MCDKRYPVGYRMPEKNVRLISCIDLRLTDDLVRFVGCDKLTNRYDHFTLAGCSLGITLPERKDWQNKAPDHCSGVFTPDDVNLKCWWETLKNHIQIAIDLHEIHDIYIVAHEACGAYRGFVKQEVYNEPGELACQEQSARYLFHKIKETGFKKTVERGRRRSLIYCTFTASGWISGAMWTCCNRQAVLFRYG